MWWVERAWRGCAVEKSEEWREAAWRDANRVEKAIYLN